MSVYPNNRFHTILSMPFTRYSALFVLFLFFVTALPHQASHAQQRTGLTGYLVTTSADTLWGEFAPGDHYSRSWLISFRGINEEFFNRYRPHSVFKYLIQQEAAYYSISGFIEGEGELNFFMREDFPGEVSLYSAMITRDRQEFFVRDRQGALRSLTSDGYIDQLVNIFGDCAHVIGNPATASRTIRYRTTDLVNLFLQYYECEGFEIPEPETLPELVFEQPRERPRWGILAGTNTSNFRITSTRNAYYGIPMNYVTGFTLGGFLDIPLIPDMLYLRPEALITSRGGEETVRSRSVDPPFLLLDGTDVIDARFYYLNVNLPLRYQFLSFSNNRVYLTGGGIIGIMLHHDAKVRRELDDNDGIETFQLIDFYGEVSFGVNLGIGASFRVGGQDLMIESRYSRIFNNISANDIAYRTTALELLIGYKF